jgi:putative ATP-binding cassette transporter
MFVPQLPYTPLGDLRAVVSYPHEGVDDQDIQHALVKVALPHLAIRLNDAGLGGRCCRSANSSAPRSPAFC